MKTIFMKREQWEKWNKALRSGKYSQTEGLLHSPTDGGYCCLGVLQKVLTGEVEFNPLDRPRALPSRKWLDNNGIRFLNKSRSCKTLYRDVCPYLPALGEEASVANDSGVSFTAIADAIKEAVEFID